MNSSKIRVLIVDDSFFMRKLLKDLLSSCEEIEVCGEAKDGAEAIGEAIRLKPDVITMDYNMPKLNGLQATQEIIKDITPRPAIIMLSAYIKEGAKETLDCLRAGAVDFVTKPSGELSLDIDKVGEEIISKIKMVTQANVKKFPQIKYKKISKPVKEKINPAVKIVIIGSSTGGPPVVEDIVSQIPASLKAVVVVVQHMPAHFTYEFAQRLDKISKIRVGEAENEQVLIENQCFVCPGGLNTEIINSRKNLRENVFELYQSSNKLTPSIDVLIKSAAKIYSNNVLGIILTGMGNDGKEGCRAIKEVGGQVIVQDPKTAVIDSMPEEVIGAGLADFILSPQEIVEKINELI